MPRAHRSDQVEEYLKESDEEAESWQKESKRFADEALANAPKGVETSSHPPPPDHGGSRNDSMEKESAKRAAEQRDDRDSWAKNSDRYSDAGRDRENDKVKDASGNSNGSKNMESGTSLPDKGPSSGDQKTSSSDSSGSASSSSGSGKPFNVPYGNAETTSQKFEREKKESEDRKPKT